MATDKRKIVNCYYEDSRSGIGDFIRGSVFLYEFCRKNDIEFDIDVRHHPIFKYLNIDSSYNYSADNIKCFASLSETNMSLSSDSFYELMHKEVLDLLDTKEDVIYVFCNFSECLLNDNLKILPSINNSKLSVSCINWFLSKIKFSEQINNEVYHYLKDQNLSGLSFNVVHLRLGDDSSFWSSKKPTNHFDRNWFPNEEDCYRMCLVSYQAFNKQPLIVLSDNNQVKEYIRRRSKQKGFSIYVPHLKSGHTQKNPSYINLDSLNVEEKSFYYTAFDAKLISLASSVRSFSVYFWGSGFSCWFAKIFNKPFFADLL